MPYARQSGQQYFDFLRGAEPVQISVGSLRPASVPGKVLILQTLWNYIHREQM
jgi:hypothetical protein